MNYENNNTPKVLILGNGLLRSFGETISWENLMKSITTNERIKYDADFSNIPFPLEIVLRSDDNVDKVLSELSDNDQNVFANKSVTTELYQRIEKLLSCNFDCILTTNYGYEIEAVALGKNRISEYALDKARTYTNQVKRAESKYYLHTYYNVGNEKIWHIHGEGRNKGSIILGHYYYGSLLARYKTYFTDNGNRYNTRKEKNTSFSFNSWLDYFILGDVYMLGLGMDFSELDLWWLINRKKREIADNGSLYFFEPKMCGELDIKAELLRTYHADVEDLGYSIEEGMEKEEKSKIYREFYDTAIDTICDILQVSEN